MSDMTPPPAPPAAPPMAPAPAGGYTPASENSKILAGLACIPSFGWIIGVVILLMDPYKDEPFAKFYAVQGIALAVCSVVFVIPVLGWILGVGVWVVGIITAINAFQGKYWEVPVLGGLVKGWFNV
jgi:uncharacterized membrane protein